MVGGGTGNEIKWLWSEKLRKLGWGGGRGQLKMSLGEGERKIEVVLLVGVVEGNRLEWNEQTE